MCTRLQGESPKTRLSKGGLEQAQKLSYHSLDLALETDAAPRGVTERAFWSLVFSAHKYRAIFLLSSGAVSNPPRLFRAIRHFFATPKYSSRFHWEIALVVIGVLLKAQQHWHPSPFSLRFIGAPFGRQRGLVNRLPVEYMNYAYDKQAYSPGAVQAHKRDTTTLILLVL